MKPYYQDDAVTLHHGDALAVLSTLPAESVDCVVTSPPYYGLRDYGTGEWQGGDPECDHGAERRARRQSGRQSGLMGSTPGSTRDPVRTSCRCGAVLVDRQYGLEASPAEYVETMRQVFAEVRRVLADDGTLWLNLGDSYANDAKWGGSSGGKHVEALHGQTGIGRGRRTTDLPPKSLIGVPWRVALALQEDGWTLRADVIWHKENAMPESVADRPAKTHEHVFLFAKGPRYHFDLDAIRLPHAETTVAAAARARKPYCAPGQKPNAKTRGMAAAGANPGDVWTLPTQPFPEAHFAVMAPELARRCIASGCKPEGVVLDPFCGSGTTGMVAQQHGRRFVGIDLSRDYLDLALRTRLAQTAIVDGAS